MHIFNLSLTCIGNVTYLLILYVFRRCTSLNKMSVLSVLFRSQYILLLHWVVSIIIEDYLTNLLDHCFASDTQTNLISQILEHVELFLSA